MPSGQPVSCQGCLTGSDLVKQSNMGVFDQPPARHQLVRALGEPTLVATTWARANGSNLQEVKHAAALAAGHGQARSNCVI